MTTRRNYSAHYQCTRCGHAIRIDAPAFDYHNALTKLPRWIWPDNHRMARTSAPALKGENNG